MTRKRAWQFGNGISVLALGACLAGCGGSGAPAPSQGINAQPPSSPPPAPPPVTTDAESFRTAEYNLNWGYDTIGAAEAYAEGFTGDGVIIGVSDVNFDFAVDDVNYDPASKGRSQQIVDIYNGLFLEQPDGSVGGLFPHGPAVSAVAAGIKNDTGIHGVAFDATVLAVDFLSDAGLTISTQDGKPFYVIRPYTYLMDNGARIVNESLGSDGASDGFVANPDPDILLGIESDWVVVSRGGLYVTSAGNNSDPEPSLSVLSTVQDLIDLGLFNQGPGAMLIVGAVDQNNVIADFSDRAGSSVAREIFLVAPGVDIATPWITEDQGPGIYNLQGTSFSAPMVSGAAAILMQRWPSLTAREVANILLDTATDLGAPGTDDIYGRGLLNLAEAIKPQGTSSVAVQTVPGGVGAPVQQTGVVMGTAFGAAPGLRVGLDDVMMLDGYGRDFRIDLSGQVMAMAEADRLDQQMAQRRQWRSAGQSFGDFGNLSLSFGQDPMQPVLEHIYGEASFVGMARQQLALTFSGQYAGVDLTVGAGRDLALAMGGQDQPGFGLMSLTNQEAGLPQMGQGLFAFSGHQLTGNMRLEVGLGLAEHDGFRSHPVASFEKDRAVQSAAARLVHRLGVDTDVSLMISAMTEQDGFLGSRAAGGLALTDRSVSGFVTASATHWLADDLSLSLTATGGITDAGQVRDSVLAQVGNIATSAFSAALSASGVFAADDRMRLSVAQPLRVESAGAVITTGQTLLADGSFQWTDRAVSLAPTGREVAVEAAWGWQTNQGWALEANLAFRRDAGHIAGRDEGLVMLGVSRRF